MSTEAIMQAATNAEAAALATADAEEERRLHYLWSKPVVRDSQVAEMLGIPGSLYAQLKADGLGPRTFSVGRRLLVRVADLHAWVDARAASGDRRAHRAKAERQAEAA